MGWEKANPPTPFDFQKETIHLSHPVILEDGNEWQIPEARELPQTMILADDGTWKFEVQRKFHAFWNECEALSDRIVADGADTSISFIDAAALAMRSLILNYRLTPELASQLELFDTQNVMQLVCAPIGLLSNGRTAGTGE